jgi:hypothetical protein
MDEGRIGLSPALLNSLAIARTPDSAPDPAPLLGCSPALEDRPGGRVRAPSLADIADNGRLEMTNNAAERAIRPLKLGAKNFLFAGSDDGGRRAAIFYTLITTAKLNRLDPQAWLTDVIGRIAGHPASRIDELLPWTCSAGQRFPEAA